VASYLTGRFEFGLFSFIFLGWKCGEYVSSVTLGKHNNCTSILLCVWGDDVEDLIRVYYLVRSECVEVVL